MLSLNGCLEIIFLIHYVFVEEKFLTYSASLDHSFIVGEYTVQLPEAGVNISNIVFSQNVAPTQTKTVLHINKAVIAA